MLSQIIGEGFIHVCRIANEAAHHIAHFDLHIGVVIPWFEEPPDFLLDVFVEECNKYTTTFYYLRDDIFRDELKFISQNALQQRKKLFVSQTTENWRNQNFRCRKSLSATENFFVAQS